MKCENCGICGFCASELDRTRKNVRDNNYEANRIGGEMTVAFCGNPNCGKTSLFNIYTGSNLKVGNWPGVTVERREGRYIMDGGRGRNMGDGKENKSGENNGADRWKSGEKTCGKKNKPKTGGKSAVLVDLPGIYSLSSYTAEEKIAYDYIAGQNADIILNIADASSLYRSLYLTMSLIDMNIPVVLVLNMMDIARQNGIKIDVRKLEKKLGIPVFCSSARTGEGVSRLIERAAADKRIIRKKYADNGCVRLNGEERKQSEQRKKNEKNEKSKQSPKSEKSERNEKSKQSPKSEKSEQSEQSEQSEKNRDIEIYDKISRILSDVMTFEKESSGKSNTAVSAAADRVILNRYFCVPLFFCIMFAVFSLTYVVGNGLKALLSGLLSFLESGVRYVICRFSVNALASELILDGVLPGVFGVLTFIPVLFVMFFLIAVLEESGYLSRVSYIMNGIMSSFGLSGRALIPLLLGFGCTVPAVFAARTIENEKDRRKTVLILTYMSCSARLPLDLTRSGAFFGVFAPLVTFAVYIAGVFAAVLTLFAVKLIANGKKNKDDDENELLIELPDYKLPSMKNVLLSVKIKIAGFIKKAGTVIFIMSVILWATTHMNSQGFCSDINESFAASAGRYAALLLKPCGIGYWQTALSLLLGIAAKEMSVSSLGMIFGIDDILSAGGMYRLNAALTQVGFYPVSAFCMMLFSLLYMPCAAALAVIRKECGTARMALYALIQTLTAWTACNIVYLIYRLFCFMAL